MRKVLCQACGSEDIDREFVDVGVGTLCGPWYCLECGWQEVVDYGLKEEDTE